MSRRHLSQTAEPFQLTLFYKNVQQSYGGLQEASTAPHSVVPQATVPSAGGQESEQAVVGVWGVPKWKPITWLRREILSIKIIKRMWAKGQPWRSHTQWEQVRLVPGNANQVLETAVQEPTTRVQTLHAPLSIEHDKRNKISLTPRSEFVEKWIKSYSGQDFWGFVSVHNFDTSVWGYNQNNSCLKMFILQGE